MTSNVHPLLLCGGSGTRLWPLSRKSYPKQFAQLTGDQSLFQASALRLAGDGFADPMIVTGSDFRFVVKEQLTDVGLTPDAILIEPFGRNTAPAILAGALMLEAQAPGALMLVAPSDHVIPDADRFRAVVQAAIPAANDGQLVTFGIRPDRAETGYGWLELSTPPSDDFAPDAQPLKAFVEKPDTATAKQMFDSGTYLWNAGIFLFSTTTLIKAFEAHASAMLADVRTAVSAAQTDIGFYRLDEQAWEKLEDDSIDYAVMEKASNLSVVPYGGAWSDLGGWDAVWRESGPDVDGIVTNGPATALDCKNTLLRAEDDGQALIGIGLEDIIAVAMPDAVLIAHKDRAQDVKKAVSALKEQDALQAESLPRDYRPWGWFESLGTGTRFQVKRIVVNPGAALSLQSHKHRAEHWIVVEGTAKVTIDDEVKLVEENQSVYIPLGAVHRMENPSDKPMVLIEVQTGNYLGEDDIVRYEDIYARGQGAKG
ncbi:MAG: mannose-1-phosphate guanylyltransferase/mannose-6-phosphate isomerase [Litoreibacter sp.]|uniref:mannose-1-phosphate guanylyltransferase/mannose-6-phosphate isomerase n=1 Tax=Litoreibacter sp. TaxID=1969459 RepID=UPI003298E522